MKGSHCEIIDNGIMCGVPDVCDHNFTGEEYVGLNDGSWLARHKFPVGTYPPSTKADEQALFDFLEERMITSSSSSCSKCGKLAIHCLVHF